MGQNVFDFADYRLYLKEALEGLRRADSSFSFRQFAKQAGLSSASFVILVIQGKRNISEKTAAKLAKCLNLNAGESFYFKNLVLLNQATDIETRQRYAQTIINSRAFKKAFPIAESQGAYYLHWYFVAIREMIGFKNFKEDPEWIAGRLCWPVAPREIKHAIEKLIELGLVERTPDGALRLNKPHLKTPDKITGHLVAGFHATMINKAGASIAKWTNEKRDITSLTFPVSQKSYQKIRDVLSRYRAEIVELLEAEKDVDAVYQLNMQFFPLALEPEDEK